MRGSGPWDSGSAREDELGTGASVALLGGVAVYVLSLVATRVVTAALVFVVRSLLG
jgi:hypothetical protein